MIVYPCQVCGTMNAQTVDEAGLPDRPLPCPRCEAESRIAAADMPHANEARRLYLALYFMTGTLESVSDEHVRLVDRAWRLLSELKHLKTDLCERSNGTSKAEAADPPSAPGHDLGHAGEHGQAARRLR